MPQALCPVCYSEVQALVVDLALGLCPDMRSTEGCQAAWVHCVATTVQGGEGRGLELEKSLQLSKQTASFLSGISLSTKVSTAREGP